MSPITHALFPVLVGRKVIYDDAIEVSWKRFIVIAFAGALPDLLNPHLSLEARYTSWSHSILAWILFVVVLLLVAAFSKFRKKWSLIFVCAFGYLAHLGFDMIAGGGRMLWPFYNGRTGGHYWPLWAWGLTDVLLILYVYLDFRWFRLVRKKKAEAAAGLHR